MSRSKIRSLDDISAINAKNTNISNKIIKKKKKEEEVEYSLVIDGNRDVHPEGNDISFQKSWF